MAKRWLVLAGLGIAGVSMLVAPPAEARKRHKAHHTAMACDDTPAPFTWGGLFWNGKPQPNGCSPAVVDYGQYIGQDPDPNIRLQLRRDPDNNGYTINSK